VARKKAKQALVAPVEAATEPAAAGVAAKSVTAPPAAAAAEKQPRPWGRPFPPGVSGNPAGRQLGSRNKLAEDFLADMHRQYQESGPGILRDMATSPELKDRVRFIELVHDLLPRNATLDVNVTPTLPRPLAEMTDADWEIALGIRVTKRSE
jgi:hypothetical protein